MLLRGGGGGRSLGFIRANFIPWTKQGKDQSPDSEQYHTTNKKQIGQDMLSKKRSASRGEEEEGQPLQKKARLESKEEKRVESKEEESEEAAIFAEASQDSCDLPNVILERDFAAVPTCSKLYYQRMKPQPCRDEHGQPADYDFVSFEHIQPHRLIRLRTKAKLRCYDVGTLQEQIKRGKPEEPFSRSQFNARLKAYVEHFRAPLETCFLALQPPPNNTQLRVTAQDGSTFVGQFAVIAALDDLPVSCDGIRYKLRLYGKVGKPALATIFQQPEEPENRNNEIRTSAEWTKSLCYYFSLGAGFDIGFEPLDRDNWQKWLEPLFGFGGRREKGPFSVEFLLEEQKGQESLNHFYRNLKASMPLGGFGGGYLQFRGFRAPAPANTVFPCDDLTRSYIVQYWYNYDAPS
jgi:hypothetical protein